MSQDESFWGPLLEKAVAKYSGSYEDLNDTKNMDTAAEYFIMLIGAPFKIYSINGEGDEEGLSADDIWVILREAEIAESMVVFDISDNPAEVQDEGL